MPLSEARKRANRKYDAKSYTKVIFRMKSGERERLQSYIDIHGISLNGFINSCMSHCIEHDVDVKEAKPLGEVLPHPEEKE